MAQQEAKPNFLLTIQDKKVIKNYLPKNRQLVTPTESPVMKNFENNLTYTIDENSMVDDNFEEMK